MESATTSRVAPVQLVVIGFPPDAQFRGEIVRTLSDLRGRGVVRLIYSLFVRKDAEGNVVGSMRDRDCPCTTAKCSAPSPAVCRLMARW